jgi:hypothetical protein
VQALSSNASTAKKKKKEKRKEKKSRATWVVSKAIEKLSLPATRLAQDPAALPKYTAILDLLSSFGFCL